MVPSSTTARIVATGTGTGTGSGSGEGLGETLAGVAGEDMGWGLWVQAGKSFSNATNAGNPGVQDPPQPAWNTARRRLSILGEAGPSRA